MPDHRPVLLLTVLSWLSGLALAVLALRELDVNNYAELVRAHMTGALIVCATALLAHGWVALYTWGVGRELRLHGSAGSLPPSALRSAASAAFRASVAALAGLGLLSIPGGLGLVSSVSRAWHGGLSWLGLVVLLVATVVQARKLQQLRRGLLEIDRAQLPPAAITGDLRRLEDA